MENKVLKNLKDYKLVSNGDLIVVGISGGVDSVVLLHVLNRLKSNLGFNLLAVHVNHNIRGTEAKRDQQFVVDFCNEIGVKLVQRDVYALEYAKNKKMTVEQSARELRYLEFDRVLEQYRGSKIAVAHNKDDQAETILMHLFRGAGLDGLVGMTYSSKNLIRPLLNVSRKEIEDYAEANGLKHVVDSTNLENKYTRNFVRNEILPKIEAIYPSAKSNICATAEKLAEIKEVVDGSLDNGYIAIKSDKSVNLSNDVLSLSGAQQKLLIKKCFGMVNGCVDIEEKHILQVKTFMNSQVGKQIDLPNGIEVNRTRLGLEFAQKKEIYFKSVKFTGSNNAINTPNGSIYHEVVKQANIGDGNLYCDLEKLVGSSWRLIEKGDKFKRFGGKEKLLSDFLTDKKIDKNIKKGIVVLAKGKDVLVVPNIEISDYVKIDENTKRIIKICLN